MEYIEFQKTKKLKKFYNRYWFYPTKQNDFSAFVLKVYKNFPKHGIAKNLSSRMMIYVLSGAIWIYSTNIEKRLPIHKMAIIEKDEYFALKGIAELMIISTPPFDNSTLEVIPETSDTYKEIFKVQDDKIGEE